MYKHHSALGVALSLKPAAPVTLIRPQAAARAARYFSTKFPGRSLYAVKANPSPALLETLWAAGITHFDVASIAEVRLVARTLPQAKLCFMHPVKAEEAIREAYFKHGVRTFSLDSLEELEKIVRATRGAPDLELCVRLRVSSEHSKLSLASKFGCDLADARELLQATRQAADALGICFHVGSQAMSPHAYVQAIERVRAAIVDASVTVDIVDVGGGFPSTYPGMEPPPLGHYFSAIHRAFESLPISYSAELWCEPGRALCAEYSSLLVRVEKRRGNELFINDGAYGALFDAAHLGWRFPVQLLRAEANEADQEAFSFYGPTCDDMDHMAGPFMLPADVRAGDYIEIGMLGAYGNAMRTDFNGFGAESVAQVADEPMASLYREEEPAPQQSNVVQLRR
ncbi:MULTISPECIES: type III PLP-dependent enzyme [Sphingobium]|uniref:type III PLP-dependent enzyme n=1 Tax=Sphingobium TaxID=165695 RepID=UPI0015EB584E|nr:MULTISPECIES: type III PLP-dependent enzyme [Sphingobium]MCW2350687.1 ornithine decarboxylase [Sphingobium sp. B12D2B]MCW2362103.1 ornithine decarboxylase [Sphingobium sp. B10D3B]MCW2401218.1 ornithine decarboxylase [Sphingobium sp. B10D7B]MCW2408198.1 ornithine decarboxylase [Sphingobium xanthum]